MLFFIFGLAVLREDLPHSRLAAGTVMLQSKPMRPRHCSIYTYKLFLQLYSNCLRSHHFDAGRKTEPAEKVLAIFPRQAKGTHIGHAQTGDNG